MSGLALRSSGSLVDRAINRLSKGPVGTAQIAEEVLALRGNPHAAAAAVFALLGTDARVQVDGSGVWSLAESTGALVSMPLGTQEWVVVDVETTGGSAGHGHRVIEVAAVRVAAGRVVSTFSSLVYPGRPIPRMITSLTGITPEMVEHAPPFEMIAAQLESELSGRIFVGHNAAFDWRFIATEMERCTGRVLTGPRLCTLRLAHRMLPHLRSRSLGSLAEYFGIDMETHHRALDDALATAHLLLRFLSELEDRGVSEWADLPTFFRRSPRRQRKRTAFPRSMDAA